MVTFYSF